METIQLTPAELELIKLKREKEELAQKEKIAKLKLEEEREIAGIRKRIQNDESTQTRLNLATDQLLIELSKLDSKYSILQESREIEYKLYHYLGNDSNIEGVVNGRLYYFNETRHLPVSKITHTDSKSIIHAHVDNGEIRFNLNIPGIYDAKNRRLKSAKTIDEKIQIAISAKRAKAERAQGWDKLIEELNILHPTAKSVEKVRDQFSELIEVRFENNFIINYTFSNHDGVLKPVRCSINTSRMNQKSVDQIVTMFAK